MATNNDPTPAAIQMTGESLANAIITATEQINGTRRQVPFGRHRVRTAFNKDGKRREMHKVFYQNGFRAFENTLTDEEIDLIHTVKPGKFVDGLITIIEVQDDDENQPAVHMKYNCRTADQRMQVGGRAARRGKNDTALRALLQQCLDEYDEQEADRKAARKAEIEDAINS
jgi:hypothetical protein